MILNVVCEVGRRLYHAVEDTKRWVRKPIVRALRAQPWYRRLSGLPANGVLTPAAYVAEAERSGKGGHAIVWLDADVTSSSDASSQGAAAASETPATYVARLHGARLVGRGVAVLTADGRVLSDVTVHLNGRIEDHGIMRRVWLPPAEYVSGTTAVLSAPGGNTYYHWLFDLLPRFHLIHRAGYGHGDIDHVMVNSLRAAYQRETLATLGIGTARVLSSDAHPHVRCETMILPSFPGRSGCPPEWVCDFLRCALLPDNVKASDPEGDTPRRLYVTRQNAKIRRLQNHDTVRHRLECLGFTTVNLETLSVAEQARLFHGAETIVGVHGSGFANVVFCRPGTSLLELHSPNQQPAYYETLSQRVGIRYAALIGRRSSDPRRVWDITVDPDLMERVLLPLLHTSGEPGNVEHSRPGSYSSVPRRMRNATLK